MREEDTKRVGLFPSRKFNRMLHTDNSTEEEKEDYRDNKQRARKIRRKRKVGPRWHMILRYLH